MSRLVVGATCGRPKNQTAARCINPCNLFVIPIWTTVPGGTKDLICSQTSGRTVSAMTDFITGLLSAVQRKRSSGGCGLFRIRRGSGQNHIPSPGESVPPLSHAVGRGLAPAEWCGYSAYIRASCPRVGSGVKVRIVRFVKGCAILPRSSPRGEAGFLGRLFGQETAAGTVIRPGSAQKNMP